MAVVRLLLGRGAKIDHQNIFGATALMEAAFRGNTELVRLLVRQGANIQVANIRGMDALKLALHKKHAATAGLLVEEGCDVNSGDRGGFTPLMWCAKWDFREVALQLLERGANLNEKTDKGHTALLEAIRKGNHEFVQLLESWKSREKEIHHPLNTSKEPWSFQTLFFHAAQPMCVLDREATVLVVNRQLASWFGYSMEHMNQTPLSRYIAPDDGLGKEGLAEIIRNKPESVELNILHVLAGGESRQLRWVFSYDREGGAVLGVAEDLTERQRRESQHRQSLKMEAIGQLAGGIAHDFNNQLAGILGYSEVLLQGTDPAEGERYVRRIVTCAQNAADLTQKLLAFSRKGHFRHVEVSMHSIIDEVVSILRHTIDKRIVVIQRLDANDDRIMGDPTLLQNALLNLCLNARDAMPNGGELLIGTQLTEVDDEFLTRHEYYMKKGAYLSIHVSDTGCGMPGEVKSRIFEPFFTTKAQGSGTGMGLAAVYGTMKGHKGAINVYSEVGSGTVFKAYLPLHNAASNPLSAVDPAAFLLSSKRILVVDDEEDVRNMIRAFLRRNGHVVFTSEDGEEGLSFYRENWQNIDLVVLDMVMPVLGGEDTYVAMKRLNPNVKAVLISGYSLNRQVQKLLNLGINDFIQKPFNSNALLKTIASVLSE
ncbi:response regulator, partial [Myxococcota bacterium]|nr:response regulator [Myxococcota bacterium]MBU1535564.1 response regulator [Myxococcota bacterium]